MIVMVIVTPGSAPPRTPASVPKKSGTRYFTCATWTMPSARSSNTALEIRPAPARQEYVQVVFENEIRHEAGAEGDEADAQPVTRVPRRRHRRVRGRNIQEGRQ